MESGAEASILVSVAASKEKHENHRARWLEKVVCVHEREREKESS